ncbi:MAG: SprT-like domain-containing protein [Chlamydiales bacterium]|nr:SprT-like domain-containing protein [Chlamydiales bacterium]
MQVYSKKIVRFIEEIKHTVKVILAKEVRLKVHGERFYDRTGRFSYPIKIVVYNNKNMLGYFAADFYEMGFHETLMHSSKTQLHNIIRHEIAHYLTFINYPQGVMPHGQEFKAECQKYGWTEDVYRATTCLDDGQMHVDTGDNSILRKVQKLMALSESSNVHEAELAMIKSQQLLLKHNIDSSYIGNDDEEKMYMHRVLKQKKETAKMRAIAQILETFFVSPVYFRTDGFIYLEIVGTKTNIEIAEYVTKFLEHELEAQWLTNQKTHKALKGLIAKNSFFIGIAKGYCNKIQALKREYTNDVERAVMVIEKKLVEAKSMVYSRLKTCKSSASFCSQSSALGELVGSRLNINPALTNTPKKSPLVLSFFS